MDLKQEDFTAVTGCVGLKLSPRGEERRRAPRVPMAAAVGVYRLAGGAVGGAVVKRVHARTRDLSVSGVGLLLGGAVEVGEVFIVGLPRKSGATLWMYCTVVRTSPRVMGMYHVGAKFEVAVRAEELKRTEQMVS